MTWENWSGSVQCSPSQILTPSSEAEIVGIVKAAHEQGKKIRVVGSGHSFTPVVATDDILISLDNYQGLVSANQDQQQVTVKAGTKLHALHGLLFENGFSQENLGDIDVQSIAGAISTGTHGTGASLGTIATQVVRLRLVTGTGDVITCSETENAEYFKAAQISLGALGIITEITLRVLPRYKLHLKWFKSALTDCLNNYDRYRSENRHFEFFWIPHTDAVMIKLMNITDEEPRSSNLFRQFNEKVLENAAMWAFMETSRIFPKRSSRIAKMIAGLITGGEDVQYAHEVFASTRVLRFQEMEYNLPVEHFADALRDIDYLIRTQKITVAFPVECRFVKHDDIYLSPAYQRESAYIAVHEYKGKPYQEYFDAVEAIFKQYAGRPHWGKLHTRTAADLRPAYPQWEAFHAARQQLDPDGIFMNEHLRRIFED